MNNIQFDEKAYAVLSKREFEIAKASVEGLTVQEIGHRLGITATTVSTFRNRIMDKLGCRTFIEAVAQLVRGGIV